MHKNLILFGFLFGIPLIGLIVGNLVQKYYESDFINAVQKEDNVSQEEIQAKGIDLESVCNNDSLKQGLEGYCSDYQYIKLVKTGSTLTIFLSIFLLLLVKIAVVLSGKNRTRLATIFPPTVLLLNIGLAILIVMQAAILTYCLYIVESLAIHRVHVGIIATIGIVSLIGAFGVIVAAFSMIKSLSFPMVGVDVKRTENIKLFEFIDDLSQKIGANSPDNIVLGLDPTFFVTAADVTLIGTNKILKGRTLFLSLPLMRLFSCEELRAVIGHELGHFKGEDTVYSLKFAPVYSSLTKGLLSLHESSSGKDNSGAIVLIPAILMLGYCYESFANTERYIGRLREFEADKVGASITSSKDLATSLLKVVCYSDYWQGVKNHNIETLNQGNMVINLSLFYQEIMGNIYKDSNWEEIIQNALKQRMAHPIDTHPTLNERFESLAFSISDIKKEMIAPSVASSAELVLDIEEIEKSLTITEDRILVAQGVVKIPEDKK